VTLRQHRFLPAAAEGFDKLHRRDEPLTGKLGVATFDLERGAVGVHDFEITHDASAVTVGRELSATVGTRCRAVLGFCLVREVINPGETILDLSERDENPLAVFGDGFIECGLRALEVRAISPSGENGQRETRADGPDTAFPVEQGIDVGAHETAGAGESQHGEERGLRDADPRIGGRKLALGFSDVRPAFEQIGDPELKSQVNAAETGAAKAVANRPLITPRAKVFARMLVRPLVKSFPDD
jgi:hypothetical protein